MPLDADQIEAITRGTVDLYRTAERQLLALVTRYLSAGLDAPGWAESRLAATTAMRRAAARVLDDLAEDSTGRLAQTVAEAYRTGAGAVLTDLPSDVADRLAARAAGETITRTAAMESLSAALVADVGQRHSNVLRHIEDVYRRTVAEATAVSIAGGQTRRQAAQHAYQRFLNRGVASFTDVSGRTWRLSSYVEMALRTVTQRAAVQGQTDRQLSLGLNLAIVSNVSQECKLCLVPGTVVEGPAPTGRTRSEYTGDVIRIVTASGKDLTGTPDHPVLTPHGWLALKDLAPGDQVVSHDREQGYPGVVPDDIQVPTLIEEVGKARLPVLLAGPTRRDLDQNIAYRKIRYVGPDRDLPGELDSTLSEPVADHLLIGGFGLGGLRLGTGDSQPGGLGQRNAPGGVMRCGGPLAPLLVGGPVPPLPQSLTGEGGSLLIGKSGHVVDHTVTLGTCVNSGSTEIVANCPIADAEGGTECLSGLACDVTGDELFGLLVGELAESSATPDELDAARGQNCFSPGVADVEGGHELLERLAGSVALDEIVDVSISHYSGHVWDLSTVPRWYVASGIVTHNCRPYEGKILRVDGGPVGRIQVEHVLTGETINVDVTATLDDARSRGFQHPNCRHAVRSYLPGVTRRPAGPTADPEGDDARQRQRYIERQIRKYKERGLGALDPVAGQAAQARVRAWQARMRQHLDEHPDLKRLRYREQIGAGNLPSST